MTVEITRVRDHKKHTFSWVIFRNQKIVLGGGALGESAEGQLATAFKLPKDDVRTIDIVFADLDTRDRYSDDMMKVREAWNAAKVVDDDVHSLLIKGDLIGAIGSFRSKNRQLMYKLDRSVQNEFYWESGEYNIELIVITSRLDKRFRFRGAFAINAVENDVLQKNFSKIAIELGDFQNISYDFAWPLITWAHTDHKRTR